MTTADAEIQKLARVLGVAPQRFAYLRDVPPADLRWLRERVTSTLFDAHLGALERVAAASNLLPSPLLAKLAEKVFGPLLSARIAGLVEPGRGVDIANRLPPSFLADVAAELDPRRVAGIIAGLPQQLVVDVATELARREDWITVARFIQHLPRPAIVAGLKVVPDDALPQVTALLDDR